MLGKLKIQEKLSLLKSRSGLRAIIANTGWLFADRILRMGVGLFVGVWIARYLGVQQFGVFNYASAFVALFSTLSTLGLDAIVIRSIVRDPENREQILGTAFWLKLIGGIGCLLLAFGSIFVLRRNDNLTIGLVAILASVGIFQSFDTIDLWFQSQVQSKYTVIAKNTAFIIVTLLKVALITMQAPLIAFAWAGLVEVVLGAVGLILVYKVKGHSMWSWCWSFPLAKTLLKESYPLILSGVTIMIYMRIDQIMLGEIIGENAVGLYSAATRISEVWYFIPMAIASSVYPSIYAAKEIDESLYYQRIESLIRLMLILCLVVIVPITFFSDAIVIMLFGKTYTAAGQILSIHVWSSLVAFVGHAIYPWFVAEGLTKLSLYRTLLGATSNIILNLYLIPIYSGVGAAIATLISYLLAGTLIDLVHPKSRKLLRTEIRAILPFIR